MTANNKSKDWKRVVCVVSPLQDAYSQTFIRAHKELLPAHVKSLYVHGYERFADSDGPLLKPELAGRLSRALLRRTLGLNSQYFEKAALRRFLQRNRVDAVLAEFGPTATLVMNACRELNIPLIAHFHGFDAYRQDILERYGLLYKELFKMAGAIIAVSLDMHAQLLRLGAPPQKLHYNSCGVEPSVFNDADPLRNPSTFVAVGRFVNKKAPHLTLLAFKKTVDHIPEARLIMIGDGALWEACCQMTRSLGLSNAVELRGVRPQSEVAAAMKESRAFVQHSIRTQDGDSEGTPVSVLEAGASGLPVIATRHAGIKQAVIDQETGLLVDEGDVEGMAKCMIRVAKEPHLAATLGMAARQWIRSEYSMEKSIERLSTIIEDAIRSARAT